MPLSKPREVWTVRGESSGRREDRLAVEDPLEIRVQAPGDEPVQVAVTMRTPGHDTELAVGFLFGEGLIQGRADVASPPVRELPVEGAPANFVTVRLQQGFDRARFHRNFYATSSCGVCGKAAIEHIFTTAPPSAPGPIVSAPVLQSLPDRLRTAQTAFAQTGGLHATGAFDTSGTLLLAREDVGRHNALDKVIGHLWLAGALPLARTVLLVSGRASFELVQKAAMAQVPILCAIGAPSTLAVETAERVGMTLVGFLRPSSLNVYSHPERVAP